MEKKLEYYICLFLYALKDRKIVQKYNLFRYVYIFNVSTEYLSGSELITDSLVIDKDLGLANTTELTTALYDLNSREYISINGSIVNIQASLIKFIDTLRISQDKVKHDLNNVLYFVNIVSQYDEDVILSAFFNDPNIEDAISRNKKTIILRNNRLKEMLEEFENASAQNNNSFEKYDVFTAWLDYIFEEYLKEKKLDE